MSGGLDIAGSTDDSAHPRPVGAGGPGALRLGLGPAAERGGGLAVSRRAGHRWLSGWEARYTAAVIATDICVLLCCAAAGFMVGLARHADLSGSRTPGVLAAVSVTLVICALLASRCWDPRILGAGSEEFSRVIRAFASCVVVLGLAGLALQTSPVRFWVFGVLPTCGLTTMGARYGLRRVLHHARGQGRCMLPVLAVGTEEAVADLVTRTRRVPHNGWVVVGACTPTGAGADGVAEISGVPVVGDLDGLAEHVRTGGYRVVAVAPAPGWTPKRMHRLAWDLEGTGSELVVDPGLMEVAGPRLHVAPVDGLPLLRLTEPRFTGVPRVVKNVIDRSGAALLMVLLAPLLLAIAVAVKLDGGPICYRQTRIGMGGRPFTIVKFRSMVVGADRWQDELARRNDGAGPLFKLRDDPRVTRVGALLRRYSLDELPQLVNILAGSMSLVGPRPPLPNEVATYSADARRKLLVRPGLTGLWQVSGRSDLSWEESIRLDLRYVENWSPAMDMLILWKTVWTVVRGDGAY